MKKIKRRIRNYFEHKFMTGHISIKNLTLYGRNAMHWGGHIYTKKYGYICFRLPFRCFGHWYPLYLYCSPNATPWAATFVIGHGKDDEWVKSRIRYKCFGHNFSVHGWNEDYDMENYHILRAINNCIDGRQWYFANYAREKGYDKED